MIIKLFNSILIFTLALGLFCCKGDRHVAEKAMQYFHEKLLLNKNLCNEDPSLDVDFVAIFFQSDFEKYCVNGFLYDKYICSNYILNEYSIPYLDTISLSFKDNHLESEYQFNSELWEYYMRHHNNKEVKLFKYFKNINHCDNINRDTNRNNLLILNIMKPLKSKEYYYIQLDLNQPNGNNFMTMHIYLNHKLEYKGWSYEKKYLD
jgi:hypothetical protein